MRVHHVNLLDQEAAGPGQTELNYLSIVIVVAILLVLCLGFTIWQRYSLSLANKQLEQVKSEVTQLSASATLGKRKDSEQENFIKINHPISWSNLLKEVAHAIPSSVQVSQLAASISPKRILTLEGSTHSLPAIFTLKDNLLKIPDCEDSYISNINQSTFQIECKIR
jgi:hypothetical protein